MYEINLKPFKIDLFYNTIVEIISRNMGWTAFQTAVFEHPVERDYTLHELEETFGIQGSEIKTFEGDAKRLYKALKELYPEIKLTVEQEKELKKVFLEILTLNLDEILYLFKISKEKVSRFNEIRKYETLRNNNDHQRSIKLNKIDDKLNEIFFH